MPAVGKLVLGKYRKGELMSSAKDPQANGAVSSVAKR